MSWKDILKAEEKMHCGTEKGGCTGCPSCEKEDFEKTEPKPDFIDLDKDGNKKESMKQAAKDAKKKPKSKNPFTRKD